MRGERGQGFGEVEVVGELGPGLLLALADGRAQAALLPQALAQGAGEVGVLGEALHQDRAGPVQGGLGVGHALVGVHVGGGDLLRVLVRVPDQPLGERFETGLAGDLGLGAALGLVGEVDVLQTGLGVGRVDAGLQLVVQLALGTDRLQDRAPAFGQFTQVAQAFLEGAQLGVVQRSGRLLAVPGDEGHGRPGVEHVDGGTDLVRAHAELLGDALVDRGCHRGRHE